jgi:hypothetical protein
MANRYSRYLATAALAVGAIALAACSDSTTEPNHGASATTLRPDGAHYTIASTSVTTATLYPWYDNVYVSVEGHRIVIPAYSICAVGTSGYGPGYWDQPCSPQTAPVVFTITTTTDANGSSRVTVQPDVRFAPGKTVMAYLKDSVGARTPGSYIAYCTLLGGCVDEGKTDASMKTYQDPTNGIIYRRLKHFSGYNVVFGVSGCDSSDPSCSSSAGMNKGKMPTNNAATLKSGYITTVGFGDSNDDSSFGSIH